LTWSAKRLSPSPFFILVILRIRSSLFVLSVFACSSVSFASLPLCQFTPSYSWFFFCFCSLVPRFLSLAIYPIVPFLWDEGMKTMVMLGVNGIFLCGSSFFVCFFFLLSPGFRLLFSFSPPSVQLSLFFQFFPLAFFRVSPSCALSSYLAL